MKLLSSYWFLGSLAVTLAFTTSETILYLFTLQIQPAIHAELSDSKYGDEAPTFWSFRSREIEKLVTDLKAEREEIRDREVGMLEMESRMKAEKSELKELREGIVSYREELSEKIVEIKGSEKKNLQELAATYSTLKPEEAVQVFSEMDDVFVVKILSFMGSDTIGPIFAQFTANGDSKRVANLTRLMRLRQKPK